MTEPDPKEALQRENLADFEPPQAPEKPLEDEHLPAALEALLFVAGDPLPLDKIAAVTGVPRPQLRQILAELSDRYAQDRKRGLLLREVDGAYCLSTKPEYRDIMERFFQPRHRPPLSQAAYETLAIIAYNQPVTRAQVEAVRGVNSDSIIARLLERRLIEEAGTLDAPGRPALFATTPQFLYDFGLQSTQELPPMEMLMYGTLRDFEESLETAAGQRQDRQMTIDQLVSAVLPEQGAAQDDAPAPNKDTDASLEEGEVVDVSQALFGHTSEADEDG